MMDGRGFAVQLLESPPLKSTSEQSLAVGRVLFTLARDLTNRGRVHTRALQPSLFSGILQGLKFLALPICLIP